MNRMNQVRRRSPVGERRAATLLMAVLALTVFVLVEVWALRDDTDTDTDAGSGPAPAGPSAVTAAGPVDVSGLRVAPDRHGRDYRREAFGPGWAPAGGPGCNVCDAVLARDLTDTTVKNSCDVTSGTLWDPYSGQTVTGPTRHLDVDHVIPLALAHRSGAHAWTDARREEFANDPDNLRATTAAVNRSKSDHGPEHWMPRSGRVSTPMTSSGSRSVTSSPSPPNGSQRYSRPACDRPRRVAATSAGGAGERLDYGLSPKTTNGPPPARNRAVSRSSDQP